MVTTKPQGKYAHRWLHAKRWAEAVKRLFDTGEYLMEFDGQYYEPQRVKIRIDEELRTIDLVESGSVTNCTIGIFDGNPESDNGAHDSIKHFKETVIDKVFLYKKVPIKFN